MAKSCPSTLFDIEVSDNDILCCVSGHVNKKPDFSSSSSDIVVTTPPSSSSGDELDGRVFDNFKEHISSRSKIYLCCCFCTRSGSGIGDNGRNG